MARDVNWPTHPDAKRRAGTIKEVMRDRRVAPHAALLLRRAHEAVDSEDDVTFQTVVDSALGAVTLPCVNKQFDGSQRIMYSHCGKWDDGDLDRLLYWAIRVRASMEHTTALIELVHDFPPPAEANDIVSQRPATLLSLVTQPYISPDDPGANADLFVGAMGYVFDVDVGYDAAGLGKVDQFVREKMEPVPDSFTFRPTLIALLGSTLGQACVEKLDARWTAPATSDIPPWMAQLRLNHHTLSPMAHASAFLRRPDREPGLSAFFEQATGPEPPSPTSSDAQEGQLQIDAKERIYRILCHLAHVDGEVHPKERRCLNDYRDRLGLHAVSAETLEKEAKAGKFVELGRGSDERQFLILAMTDVVAADGYLAKAEERRLTEIGREIGLDVGLLLKFARSTVKRRAESGVHEDEGF